MRHITVTSVQVLGGCAPGTSCAILGTWNLSLIVQIRSISPRLGSKACQWEGWFLTHHLLIVVAYSYFVVQSFLLSVQMVKSLHLKLSMCSLCCQWIIIIDRNHDDRWQDAWWVLLLCLLFVRCLHIVCTLMKPRLSPSQSRLYDNTTGNGSCKLLCKTWTFLAHGEIVERCSRCEADSRCNLRSCSFCVLRVTGTTKHSRGV